MRLASCRQTIVALERRGKTSGSSSLADRPLVVHAGHASLRSLVAPVRWSRCTHAWDQGLESLAVGRARSAGDIFGFIHPVVRVGRSGRGSCELGCLGHAAASDPRRKSEPSTHMRCRTTAILRATATTARRRPLVFIRRTPQAFRLDQAMERMSMALAAA